MPGVVSDVVRSVGLSTAMRAAGVVTGLLPIPQPMLLIGPGASRRLGQALCGFGHKKILIVTDRVVSGMGLPDGLTKALSEGGIAHVVFDAVLPDAPIPIIEEGIAFFEKHRCDAVVAFGGGSPMDAAKTIALAVANKKHPRKLVGYFKGLRAPVPTYAVPTTAGTGSEVTVAAVVSDPETNRKLVIADTRLVPTMAALDPSLMIGLPRHVTAATGMDALTHAIEAFVGHWSNEPYGSHGAGGRRHDLRQPAHRVQERQESRGARADVAGGDLRRPGVHTGQRGLCPRHRASVGWQVPHASRPGQRDCLAARAEIPESGHYQEARRSGGACRSGQGSGNARPYWRRSF